MESSSHAKAETKTQLESSVEEEIEHVIAKPMQITKQNDSEKQIEFPMNMIPTEVESEPVRSIIKFNETHVMTEIIKEHKRSEPIQEIVIRDMASRMNDELKSQQVDVSLEEVIPVVQPEEQAEIKQIQPQNEDEVKKDVHTNPHHMRIGRCKCFG